MVGPKRCRPLWARGSLQAGELTQVLPVPLATASTQPPCFRSQVLTRPRGIVPRSSPWLYTSSNLVCSSVGKCPGTSKPRNLWLSSGSGTCRAVLFLVSRKAKPSLAMASAMETYQLSFPLPRSLEARIYVHLTIQAKSVMIFLTTAAADELGTPPPMGSFVYALPDVSCCWSPLRRNHATGTSADHVPFVRN